MRGRLICLIGIDGAGKTTLVNGTVERLKRQGVRAAGVYGKTLPVLSRLLMAVGRAAFLRKQDIWQDYPNYARHKKRVMNNRLLTRIYEVSVWLDYLPQAYFKIVLPLLFGVTIMCDRYLFDVVIGDLAVHSSYDARQIRRSLNAGFRVLPEPDLVFLIDLPEEVAIRRKDDVPHIEYLSERRRLYLRLAETYPIVKLDGEETPEELMRQIVQRIGSPLPKAGEANGQ